MNLRLIVTQWDEGLIIGHEAGDALRVPLSVCHGPEWRLAGQLYPQAVLNLLDVTTDEAGHLRPGLIILEPDYLIDITTICQCVKSCGTTPYHYLMAKFMPREDTLAIQLGNAANQFLDDAVNGNDDYLTSMRKNFKDYPLKYCTLEGVDRRFFDQCRLQHAHLQQVVHQLFPQSGIGNHQESMQLEPSFICEPLGLQGRMDLLTSDLKTIVELKSGKSDEYHHTFKTEHAWQMVLYREMLHYSMGRPREDVQTLLLYSRYPELHDIRLGRETLVAALAVRNGIVHIDRMLREHGREFLLSLTEDDFNPLHSDGKLYHNYLRPRIMSFLGILHGASSLAFDYFTTMVSFLQREQLLAKVGDGRPESYRAFARAWLCDTPTKLADGNIVTDLRLTPILDADGMLTHLRADFTSATSEQSNFREGDGVMLYERNTESDLMTNRQTVRCSIETLHADHLLLRLSFPQRGLSFLRPDSLYAIEPSYSDSLFAVQYRGLFALLSCPPERRSLILGERTATPQDYYLLVGPPGSGKTSVALRQMVQDFCRAHPDDSILLMAYTNRAVDEICQMLEGIERLYVRIGQDLSCAPEYRHRLMRNVIAECNNRQEILNRLRPVRIFCGTVASLSQMPELFRLRHFPVAILDEASQVLEPQLMPLLCATTPDGSPAIGHLVLIGDHKQLPAVVVQPTEDSHVRSAALQDIGLTDCRDSLFERLLRRSSPDNQGMLTRQGRMHESINAFVSKAYYEGRLSTLPLPHQTAREPWAVYDSEQPLQRMLARQRLLQFDVPDPQADANDKINTQEARLVARIVEALHRLALLNQHPWQPERQVGIIVPFRGQISVVRHQLEALGIPHANQITIDTVERYQGSQREVIIFSTVVRRPYQLQTLSAPVMTAGTPVDRKLNVAITRARSQFILVGNLALLRQAPEYQRLIAYIVGSTPSLPACRQTEPV